MSADKKAFSLKIKLSVEIDQTTWELLRVLSQRAESTDLSRSVEDVLLKLIDHARQGVYRPGAWEREWLEQAFGCDWQEKLEWGDPFGRGEETKHIFQRPKREKGQP